MNVLLKKTEKIVKHKVHGEEQKGGQYCLLNGIVWLNILILWIIRQICSNNLSKNLKVSPNKTKIGLTTFNHYRKKNKENKKSK